MRGRMLKINQLIGFGAGAGGGGGLITLVGSSSAGSSTGNYTLVLPAGMAQNDVVYVIAGRWSGGSSTSSTGWTTVVTTSRVDARMIIHRKVMGATPDASIALNATNHEGAAAVAFVFRSVNATPEDATATAATGNSAAPDPPSITTTTSGAWVLACAAAIGGLSTAPSGYSNSKTKYAGFANSEITVGGATKLISLAGAENPATWTSSKNGDWVAASVAVRSA